MWTEELFKVKKPIIALLHLRALPGDPDYCGNMEEVIDCARADLRALQEGGVDGVLFANEFSMPYQPKVDYVTVAAMAHIYGRLRDEVKVPHGMNVVLNPMATIELAVATDAYFARSAFTGAYTGEQGVTVTDVAATKRRIGALGRRDLKLLFKANPESDTYLADRPLEKVVKSIIFAAAPDALCVSGGSAGSETNLDTIKTVRAVAEPAGVPVLCNTGCNAENVREMLDQSDGVCMGTYFKKDGYFRGLVDVNRVRDFMEIVKNYRKTL